MSQYPQPIGNGSGYSIGPWQVLTSAGNNISSLTQTALTFGNTTDNPASTFNGGVIATGARPTLNTAITAVYIGGLAGVAQTGWTSSTAGLDAKVWDVFCQNNAMTWRLINDANNVATNWMTVTRSGTTVSSVVMQGPITVNTVGAALTCQGAGAGAANVAYIQFVDSGAVRKGYVGDGSSGDSDITLSSDAGNLKLIPATGLSILGTPDGGVNYYDMTPSAGTFTGTFTGFSGSVTATCSYYKVGKLVTMHIGGASGTSNSNILQFSGFPAQLRTSTSAYVSIPALVATNNSTSIATASLLLDGGSLNWEFVNNGSGTGWTASGTKGVGDFFISYISL